MRDRDRLLRMLDRVERGAIADMREVDQDARAVHLVHDLAAEARQAGVVGLVAASAEVVLVVVGELNDADAHVGEQLDEMDAAVEQRGVLEAEHDGDAPGGVGGFDVLAGERDRHDVGVLAREIAPPRDGVHGLDRRLPESERGRDAGHAGLAQLFENRAVEMAALQGIDQHQAFSEAWLGSLAAEQRKVGVVVVAAVHPALRIDHHRAGVTT